MTAEMSANLRVAIKSSSYFAGRNHEAAAVRSRNTPIAAASRIRPPQSAPSRVYGEHRNAHVVESGLRVARSRGRR